MCNIFKDSFAAPSLQICLKKSENKLKFIKSVENGNLVGQVKRLLRVSLETKVLNFVTA